MAYITFEQPWADEKEHKLGLYLSKAVQYAAQASDCRDLRELVRAAVAMLGLDFQVGTGGSHIWLHRTSEHTEGNPHLSIRWAIITDAPLTNQAELGEFVDTGDGNMYVSVLHGSRGETYSVLGFETNDTSVASELAVRALKQHGFKIKNWA